MDESEKKKVLADLDVFVPDDDEENSGSSPRDSASSKSFGGSGVADENNLLKHGVDTTSCLRDNSSHVGTIDDASNNEVDNIANITTQDQLRSTTKKQRRKKHILYAVILLLCVIVIALAISLGVSSNKGDQYSSAEYNTFNEVGGEEGPPPGIYPMQGVEEELEDEELGTIVDIALGDQRFTTLVAAVTAAQLSDILSSDSSFTVFGK